MKKVAVVAGGYSGEHEISLKSAKTIMDNLDRSRFEPILVEITREAWVVDHSLGKFQIDKSDFTFQTGEDKIHFDYAYIIIHGTPGEDGKLQGYLDMMGVPYSTGSAMNMSVTFNKGLTQRLLRSYGFNVAEFVLLRKGEELRPDHILSKVGLPCFVKPAEAGSSLGISKVKEEEELAAAVEHVLKVDDQIMIEAFLDGREITCGVCRVDGKITALPVTEIISESEFFDYEAKYNDKGTQEITPADIPEEAYQRCQAVSEQVYDVMQCEGIVRIDFFLCEEDLYVVEINGVPGMSAASIVPKMIEAADQDIGQIISDLIETQLNSSQT
jgi:D-alanine-D-alanine ligase